MQMVPHRHIRQFYNLLVSSHSDTFVVVLMYSCKKSLVSFEISNVISQEESDNAKCILDTTAHFTHSQVTTIENINFETSSREEVIELK
jgi:hypothetical protein